MKSKLPPIVSLALAACLSLFGLAEKTRSEQPPDREAVLSLVEDLSSARFKTRQKAAEELWKLGPSIGPLLVESLKTADAETEERILEIQHRFAIGITPDTPARIRQLIADAIDGKNEARREQATMALAREGQFKPVLAVLKRMPVTSERRRYFSLTMTAIRQIKSTEVSDQFHAELLEMAVGETNPQDGSFMVSTVVNSQSLRPRLSSVQWIEKIIQLATKYPGPSQRRRLIDPMYFYGSDITGSIHKKGLLAKWINLVASDPDRTVRLKHISKLLRPTRLTSTSTGYVQIKVEKLYADLTPAGQHALIDLVSTYPPVLKLLHQRIGDDKILVGCRQTKDPEIRGNLVGHVLALESWPTDSTDQRTIIDFVNDENVESAKQQLVVGFLQCACRPSSAPSPAVQQIPRETKDAIWELITTGDPQLWQLRALLQTYGSKDAFGEYHDAETLSRMLAIVASVGFGDQRVIATAPLSNQYLADQIREHDLPLRFLKSLSESSDTSAAGTLISGLLSSVRFTAAFDDAQERQSLLEFCKSDLNAQAKRYAAVGLLGNVALMTKLLEESGYDSVKDAMLARLPDDNSRDDILGRLISGEATVKHLVKTGKLEELLKFKGLEKKSLVALLRPIVASDAAVAAIVESDQLDALIEAIERVEVEYSQADLKRQLMARPGFVKQLAKKNLVAISLKEFQSDENWMRYRGYEQFIEHLELTDVKGDPELAATFWKLVPQLESDYAKRECINKLLSSRWFLPQLIQQGNVDLVTDSIGDVLNKNDRRHVIQAWMRHENTVTFMNADRIAAMLQLCEVLSKIDQRSAYSSLARTSQMRTWFEGKNQPDAFLKLLDAVKDDQRRAVFAESILASGILSQQRDNEQLAGKLIAFVSRQPKSLAARLGMVLVSQYQITDEVMNSKLPQLVIAEFDRSGLEVDVIKQMLKSSRFASMLVKQKVDRKLADKILAMTDPKQRFECLQLMAQNQYFQRTLSDDELKGWFDEYLKQLKSATVPGTLFQYPTTVQRLIDLGYFNDMRKLIDAQDLKATPYSSVAISFYTSGAVIKQMRSQNQSADVLYNIIEQSDERNRRSHLMRLMSYRTALRWALETCEWSRLKKQLDGLPARDRIQMIPRLVRDYKIVEHLVKHDALESILDDEELRSAFVQRDSYVDLLRSPVAGEILESKLFRDFLIKSIDDKKHDADSRRRIGTALSYSRCYPHLLKHGHGDWLFETLERLSAEDLADSKSRRHKDTLNRVVAIAIQAGRLDDAQRILSRFLQTDEAKIRLTRFLLVRGKLDEYAKNLDAQPIPATEEQRVDRQQLHFFLRRAAKRFDDAEMIAKDLGDPWSWSLAMEQHKWSVARDIPVCEEHELPLSRTSAKINSLHRQVEQLGFSIAFDRLAGQQDQARQSMGELTNLIDANLGDLNNVRYGADALLMNGKSHESLRLLDKHLPRRAFYWHWDRLEFDTALSLIGWSADKADQCFDQYSNGEDGHHQQRTIGVNFMLDVAKMLRLIGRKADMNAALDALVRHPQSKDISAKQRRDYLGQLCKRLYEEGFSGRSRAVAAELIDEQSMAATTYFAYVYGGRSDSVGRTEATIWWNEFNQRHADETTVETLARVDGAVTATTPIDQLRPLPKSRDDKNIVTVPVTCFRYGLLEEARQIFTAREPLQIWDHAVISGRMYLASKDYEAAANAFHRAWELRRTDLTRLYLAGSCWQQAGNVEKGRQVKQMAMLLPTSDVHLNYLTIGLTGEGRVEDAADVAQVVLRTAAPGSRPYIDSLVKVYEQTEDATEKMQLWREHCMYHLRPIQFYPWVPGWVRSITRHHALQAIAAIDQGDMAAVESAWQDAKQISQGYMWIAHWIVPELRKHDQHALADKVYRAHENYLLSKIEEYPASVELKNRLKVLHEICAAEAVAIPQ